MLCWQFDISPRLYIQSSQWFNTLRPRQNGRHFADDTFKHIFLTENIRISIKISLKFVPKGSFYNIPALIQIMAWRRPGDKPLSEPMMVSLLTHICVTWPQWVKLHILISWCNMLMLWANMLFNLRQSHPGPFLYHTTTITLVNMGHIGLDSEESHQKPILLTAIS